MVHARVELRPSEIRYTHDSIKNTFTVQHEEKSIGETLDDLCDGVCDVSDIPPISVFLYKGHYWSADNRRLWVLRQFERLGGCQKVIVAKINIKAVNFKKFTTNNDGAEVRVRGHGGDPGGMWHRCPDNFLGRQRKSSRHGRHSRKVVSFDTNTTSTVPLPSTARRPPTPTATVTSSAPESPHHQEFGDPYSYGHAPSPVFAPARPVNIVSPCAHAHTPYVEPMLPYSQTVHSCTGNGGMSMARGPAIDIPYPWTPTPPDHYPYGHGPTPGFVPARPADMVSPCAHAHTPYVQPMPPYSPTGYSPHIIQLPKKSRKKRFCVIS